MKKVLSSLIVLTLAFCLYAEAKTDKTLKMQEKAQKKAIKQEQKFQKELAKAKNKQKDVLSDVEYKDIKTQFFNAEGYGSMYNCKVEQEKFCKVKDYDTGIYVLCDRQVSRTQMESAKIFHKYGRCVKLN